MMCYALGALLAAALTSFFLVPISNDHREYYRDSVVVSTHYLNVLEQTTMTTTSTTTSTRNGTTTRSRIPTRTTTRPPTTTAKPLPDLIILDFLRYDSNDLYDENDTLHRVFAQHFFNVYYIVSSACALTMIAFLVFYVVELKASSKSNQNESHELGSDAKTPADPVQTSRIPFKKRFANFISQKLVNSMSGNRGTEKCAVQHKPSASIYLWNCCILVSVSLFYALTYGSHKIQANYFTSYAIQAEYLKKNLQNNEILGFEAKITSSNWSNLLSFTNSYNTPSMSFIQANYSFAIYYAGIFIGLLVNLGLLSPIVAKYLKPKPIVLAYTSCILHLMSRTFTLVFASVLISNDSMRPLSLTIWWCLCFLNGLFIAPLPALLFEYLSSASPNIQFSVLSKNLAHVELISLSMGVALFQFIVGHLIDSTKTFNALINIGFINALAMVSFLALVHLIFKYIPRKHRLINPS
jgi:hypothetical protein